MKQLLTSVQNVKKRGPISGDLDPDKIKQYIEIAQDKEIQNLLGTDLLEKLQTEIAADNLSPSETTLMGYVKPVLEHYAIVEILHTAGYTIGDKGVFKHTSENAETVSKEEVDSLAEKHRQDAMFYARRLVDYLCNNSSTFPEYTSNTDEDMNPSTRTDFMGWHL